MPGLSPFNIRKMSEDNTNDNPVSINSLTKDQLIEKIAGLEEEKASLIALNDELNEELQASESKSVAKFPTFKVGKETYELIAVKSKYKGKEVTAQTLKEDENLLKELVKINAGILRLVIKGDE